MKKDPMDKVVTTRAEFLSFLHQFVGDLEEHPESWENADLGRFLHAMHAWIEDMDGFYQGQNMPIPDKPDWEVLRHILCAARVYE
jgi:hypothetical protein